MTVADALAHAGDKPAGKRPYFMTPEVERVFAVTLAVIQELAVTRARLDTVERLLAARGIVNEVEIETYAPDPATAEARGLWLDEYLARVLRIVQQEGQAIAADATGDVASEEVAAELTAE